MRPSPPTSAQSEVEAQEAPKRALCGWPSGVKGMRFSKCQALAPPVGSVEVITSPLSSTARQASAAGQETPVICTEPPAFASLQVAPPPARGFVVVRMLPVMLPTAQSTVETQEAPSRSPAPAGVATDLQAPAPPVGSVEAKSRPPRAAATQSEGVPQEMLRRSS